MIYVQVEHQLFKAKTYKALVKRLWDTSFDEAINKENFMFDVKRRIDELYNKHISTENYEKFILDLDQLGLIKLFRCSDCENYDEQNSHPHCMAGITIFNKNLIECPTMINKDIKILENNEEIKGGEK